MPTFIFHHLPDAVSEERRIVIESHLSQLQLYAYEKDVVLSYIGGITNHGFRDAVRNVFIRVPGNHSHLLVDRKQEFDTLQLLADLHLYPPFIEAYFSGDLAGYKVDPFIEGHALGFVDFQEHQPHVLPLLKILHDSARVLPATFTIFDRLWKMHGLLIDHSVTSVPFLNEHHQVAQMPIAVIEDYLALLQSTSEHLFPYLGTDAYLSPCHNDITPCNFIRLTAPIRGMAYQIVDFEYAAMNDPMYDLAVLAAMQNLSCEAQTQLVLTYFAAGPEQTAHYSEDIKRVRFYTPLVRLYYSLWSTLQVQMQNESREAAELKSGWGPHSLNEFLRQFDSHHYQALIQSASKP